MAGFNWDRQTPILANKGDNLFEHFRKQKSLIDILSVLNVQLWLISITLWQFLFEQLAVLMCVKHLHGTCHTISLVIWAPENQSQLCAPVVHLLTKTCSLNLRVLSCINSNWVLVTYITFYLNLTFRYPAIYLVHTCSSYQLWLSISNLLFHTKQNQWFAFPNNIEL